jgi:hypothetical protein
MPNLLTKSSIAALTLLVSACATIPNGPSVMVLPGNGQSFEQFRNDDAVCQQFADFKVGGVSAKDASIDSGLTSAAVGTALGAAAGAAIGNGGRGAAIGAGTGLLLGGLVGSSSASTSAYEAQERFDTAYIQCMYAKGHQVPISGQFTNTVPDNAAPPAADIPPPPPGSPPAPPDN